MSDLPAHVKRDLDRAAAGIGRTPTTAHPDCICGKPTGRTVTVTALHSGAWVEVEVPEKGNRDNCPQHQPEPKP